MTIDSTTNSEASETPNTPEAPETQTPSASSEPLSTVESPSVAEIAPNGTATATETIAEESAEPAEPTKPVDDATIVHKPKIQIGSRRKTDTGPAPQGSKPHLDNKKLEDLIKSWSPYNSTASLLLWKSIEEKLFFN